MKRLEFTMERGEVGFFNTMFPGLLVMQRLLNHEGLFNEKYKNIKKLKLLSQIS